MPGLYFEQFGKGQAFERPWTRTVTETDTIPFSPTTMHPAKLRIDAARSATTELGQPTVTSSVIDKRASKSRHDQRIGEFRHEATNQRDEVMASCRRPAPMLGQG